ncbi:C40 family peptidase [Taibaiella koreensis]|uniref:C40 family peptidase n=1 Tax=Taibaiella koreensis TaxID=1268548 RepID=UPI000E59B011|nr:C40 family peptidase [Taibaiella koreensis]
MTLAYAVCSVSVMPLRAEPSHRAEQVSQLLFGERMEVLAEEKNGWLQVRCEWDDYEGWVKKGQVAIITYKEYRKPLHYYNTGITDLVQVEHGHFLLSPGSSLFLMKRRDIKWGAKEYSFKGRKVALKQIEASAEGLRAYSKLFAGSPYQWGGRSLMGLDCSGFTQVVYKLLNTRIPRDASQQALIGETVDFLQEVRCGDLAFFDNEEGRINHVGILLNDHTIIHATETSGCVVTDPIDNGGIISKQLRMRTHKLRLIKRVF